MTQQAALSAFRGRDALSLGAEACPQHQPHTRWSCLSVTSHWTSVFPMCATQAGVYDRPSMADVPAESLPSMGAGPGSGVGHGSRDDVTNQWTLR